jgi:hypothetical protein
LAGSAFKDAEVLKLADKFVAILVDGDEDKEFGKDFGVSGFPNTVFADPRGKKVAVVTGAVSTGEFLDKMKAAVKKIGPVQPKKAAKELEEAVAALAKAREKGDWRAALKQVAAIEKINHEGPGLDAARDAKKFAAEEGAKRLAAAREQFQAGKSADARAAAAKVVSDFEGTEPAKEAKAFLKEIQAAEEQEKKPAGGGEAEKPK